MEVDKWVTGLQHIGIPTNDIEKTVKFYNSLGYETAIKTVNQQANEAVAFLRLKNIVIETYENKQGVGHPGAIDHVALDVTDVEAVFQSLKEAGYDLLDNEVQFLPFWDNGVKFFTIMGPNAEKIEFSQML